MNVRIYYEDTDAGGIVYHANYLKYMERARTEFLRDKGLSVRRLQDEGFVFPVVRAEVDFRAAAVHDDLLEVTTEVVELRNRSFRVKQRVLRQEDGKLLVEGIITLACIGPDFKARRLPDVLVTTFSE